MPIGPVTLQLRIIMNADAKSVKRLARDVEALCDLVPEWNQMEADEIKSRIGRRIAKWIKAKQVE